MNTFVQMRVNIYIRLLLVTLCCASSQVLGANTIAFSENCIEAQKALFKFKLDHAEKHLEAESRTNPNNAVVDYLMVMHSMLSYTTNETKQGFTTFDSLKEIAIKNISAAPEEDGTKDFLLEEVYFYSSVVNGKKGNNIAAANDVRNCYKYGTLVLKNHPDYVAAKKTLGLLKSGFGSLPTNYQKLVQFFGFESSMVKGLEDLNSFITTKSDRQEWIIMKKEAQFFVASIHLYLKNDKTKAWTLIDSLTQDHAQNPLSRFARVNFADKCRKNDEIIRVITQAQKSTPDQDIPFLSFMLGKAKLNRLDPDADSYLLQYLDQYQGGSYVKSCYQKLCWHAVIQGHDNKYATYLNELKDNGNTELEVDEQAQKFAVQNKTPNSVLLQTRLLFDGGYYTKALKIIRPNNAGDFEKGLVRTEYFYRKGRIYDALHQSKLAEAFYLEAMQEGNLLSQYYASYATLYLAEMYERNGDSINAKKYFKLSMSYDANKEYKKSIEHRAKNGLDRIDQN